MDIKEQVTAISDAEIAVWDDVSARDAAWASLRDKSAAIAAEAGMVLDPHGRETDVRHVLWMRTADGVGGEPVEVETTREHAGFVRLRLSCWASKD